MKHLSVFLLSLLLTACSTSVSTNVEDTAASSSSVAVSSASQSQSASSQPPVLLKDALDQTFSSATLDILVHYPSTVRIGECEEGIPVHAREGEYKIEFVVEHLPDETCGYLSSEVLAEIHVQRATELADVRAFVDRVFSPDCEITAAEDGDAYQMNGDQYTHVFLHSKNPPIDEPDFACGEAITWNRTAGVVLFSSLGSKTGGGIEWPADREILLPDGNIEYAFDFLIMDSIEFLKP